MQFIMSGSIFSLPPYTRGEKTTIWSELESNPGPLASQATALTNRPLLLGQKMCKMASSKGSGSAGSQVAFEIEGLGFDSQLLHRALDTSVIKNK